MKKYQYVGSGIGVPGLPHEISDEEAEALGVAELLNDAVSNGNYAVVTPHPPLPKSKDDLEREKPKKELNNG